MGLEIKGKTALGNKTLCPGSPKAKGGATGAFSACHSVLGPCTRSKPPESEGVQAPSLPYPCYVPLYLARITCKDAAAISTPPPTVTVPTAASVSVSLTSSGQARPSPTV